MKKEELLNAVYTYEQVVTEEMTAAHAVEGTPKVFGTPVFVELVERTCYLCMAQAADEDEASVGVTLSITHSSPTPVGMKVTCDVKVEKIEKAMVTFSFEARDEAGVIGHGTHVRAFAPKAKIEAKAAAKLNK